MKCIRLLSKLGLRLVSRFVSEDLPRERERERDSGHGEGVEESLTRECNISRRHERVEKATLKRGDEERTDRCDARTMESR
jgi:hypothetical protein